MTKLQYFALIALLIAFILTSSALLVRGQGWGDDFAGYILQAKSILNGSERQTVEQNIFAIDNSTVLFTQAAAVPWGYPLTLAPIYYVFGLNPLALNASNILFLVLFMLFFFLLLRKRLSPLEAVLAVAVLVFSPELITFQNNITSDIAFMSFSTLAILLIDRFVVENRRATASFGRDAALGAAIFWAFFIRATGALLLFTLLGCQIIALYPHVSKQDVRKKMLVHFMVPYLVFGILWGISALIFPASQEYLHANISFLTHPINLGLLKDHAWYYFHLIDKSFLSSLPGPLIVYGFLLAFFMIGMIARVEKDYALLIYSALTVLVVWIYPYLAGLRILFPVLPFFVYFSFQGMKTAFLGLTGFYRQVGRGITYLFWTAVLLIFMGTSVRIALANLAANRQADGPFDALSTQMFHYIKTATPPESVIVFFKPRAMRLMTDRNAIVINQCDRLDLGNFVVLLKGETGDQIPVEEIGSCGLDIKQVFENEKFIAYQLVK